MNMASTALRFFFHITLDHPGFDDRIARIATPERLPVVLSTEEVALLLTHAPNLEYRAALPSSKPAPCVGVGLNAVVPLKP